MKFLKVIKGIIIGLLVMVYLSFAITMTILAINFNKYGNAVVNGYTFLFIDENVANDKYKEKDLVIVKTVKNNKFNLGDEAFLYKILEDELTGSKSVTIMIGKVANVDQKKQGIMLENEEFYSREFVIGEKYKVIPGLGGLLSMILNKTGFLIVIIVPIFFIFTAQIYALIVEIKFGDGADEEKPKKDKSKKIEENSEPDVDEKPKKSIFKDEENSEPKIEEEPKKSIFKEEQKKEEDQEVEEEKPKKSIFKDEEKSKTEENDKKNKDNDATKKNIFKDDSKKENKSIDDLADDFLND